MKTIVTSKAFGKKIFIFALAVIAFSFSSCKKEEGGKPITPISNATATKAAKLRNNVSKALKDFIITFNSSNQSSGSGGGNSNYSNTGLNMTNYSTPSTNVYNWSDPTTGTQYTLTESSSGSGGGGLGQLSYNGKSFDYNYVLSIKASGNDPSWNGFFGSRDLRGAVAIDGQLTGNTFSLKNLAIFLVLTNGSAGTYKFINWDSPNLGNADGIGELLDFSDVVNNTLDGMNDAHFYITSEGHIQVADDSFTMASDAKVTDVVTNGQYSIDGSLMFL